MKNFKNNKRGLYVVIALLLVSVVGLSIAYAALSSSLNINFGTVTQTGQTWNVGFTTNSSITPTVSGSVSSIGRSCGLGSTNSTTFTAGATSLSKPGDKCVWQAVIQNTGSINAKLTNIIVTKPTDVTCTVSGASMVCGNITYKITADSSGNTMIAVNSTKVNSNSTKNVYISAEYTGTDLSSSSLTYSNAKFQLVFTQN